jgi:ABC-type transport system involved in multi-copper enzyme maturation permease subunit
MIPHDTGKAAVDMVLFAVSFSGLLLVLFIGISLLSKDLDKWTIYLVLSRPVSRSLYIVGKFIGMAMLILATLFILSVFAVIFLFILKNIYPDSFQGFSLLTVLLALVFIILMLNMVSALSFLFASFASSSFTTLILTIISYIIGQTLTAVKAIVEAPLAVGIHVSPITVKVVQAAYYLFPNLSLFDIKTQAAHGLSVSFSYVFWTISYGVVYTCLLVIFAAIIFRKREFA